MKKVAFFVDYLKFQNVFQWLDPIRRCFFNNYFWPIEFYHQRIYGMDFSTKTYRLYPYLTFLINDKFDFG